MNKKYYPIIFVVLTHRNSQDLIDFFGSLSILDNHHTIVVNSFYDLKSNEEIEEIAISNNADFINVENRGYGAGNNVGIQYARNTYDFEALIISNPDIILQRFDININDTIRKSVIAPEIIAADGRKQNPYYPYKNRISEACFKRYALSTNRFWFWAGVIPNKLLRITFHIFSSVSRKPFRKVQAAHGAFFLIGVEAIEKVEWTLFDEQMFLFNEEMHLSRLTNRLHIPILYTKKIKVFHKEDGSMKLSDYNIKKIYLQSLRTYFKLKENQ